MWFKVKDLNTGLAMLAGFKVCGLRLKAYFECRLSHVREEVTVLDELAPGLLILDASGVAKLLRPSAEVNDVRKFKGLGAIL